MSMIDKVKNRVAGTLMVLPVLLAMGVSFASAADVPLSAAEIKARIIGNTVVGVEDGAPYREYFKPDGTISGNDGTDKYAGAWRLDGSKLCMGYESDENPGQLGDWTCSGVTLSGDRVIWNDDGDLSEGRLIPGAK